MATINTLINGRKVETLFKTGSSSSWMTEDTAQHLQLPITPLASTVEVLDQLFDKPVTNVVGMVHVKFSIIDQEQKKEMVTEMDVMVLKNNGPSLCLGMDWIKNFNVYSLTKNKLTCHFGRHVLSTDMFLGEGILGGILVKGFNNHIRIHVASVFHYRKPSCVFIFLIFLAICKVFISVRDSSI